MELVEKVKNTRAKLQLLIMEADDIELREATALRVEYTEKIGQFECRQYELYLKAEEFKKKISMVQARINRNEPIDMDSVNKEVSDILLEYYQKLNGMRENVNEMYGYMNGTIIDITERSEIKQLYRRLMKVLHPDVIGNEGRIVDTSLWEKVQKAYKHNDLATLQMIADITEEMTNQQLEELSESELIKMQERMEMAILKFQTKILKARKQFPFTEAEHLKNDAWVRTKQAELHETILAYEKSVAFLQAALEAMINKEEVE